LKIYGQLADTLSLRQRQARRALQSTHYRLVTLDFSRRIAFEIQRRRRPAIADPFAPIWVEPCLVRRVVHEGIINPRFPGEIVAGEWDKQWKIMTPQSSDKVRSIILRLRDGVPWEETPLFGEDLERRLRKKGRHRGKRNIDEVRSVYAAELDDLVEDMQSSGFRLPSRRKGIDPIFVHIDRNGKVLWGGGGNHRVTIAAVIGLPLVPVFVWRRHSEWQRYRDLAVGSQRELNRVIPRALMGSPDLNDLVCR